MFFGMRGSVELQSEGLVASIGATAPQRSAAQTSPRVQVRDAGLWGTTTGSTWRKSHGVGPSPQRRTTSRPQRNREESVQGDREANGGSRPHEDEGRLRRQTPVPTWTL